MQVHAIAESAGIESSAGTDDWFAPFTMFLLYTGLMLVVASVFNLVARRYTANHG